jgi:hypothetical protein
MVCAPGTPSVCVTRAHQGRLAEMVTPSREALAVLSKLPTPPTSVAEQVDARQSQPSSVALVDLGDPAATDPRLLVLAGVRPCADQRFPGGKPYIRERAARDVTVSWLLGSFTTLPDSTSLHDQEQALAQTAWRGLSALPADEQRDRVIAARQAEAECSGDLLDVLASGAR